MEYNTPNTVTIRMPDGNISRFECHSALPSTSKLAKDYARAGYPDRYVVFAEKLVNEERNERGKCKITTRSGVYFSCILRPSIFTSQASLIGPMAAVAFVTALEEHTTRKLGIGWVSDIFCDGEKIGAVNVEGKLDGEFNFEYIIVNFAADLCEDKFPPRLADMIRKVFESENTSVSMIIAKNILTKFFALFESFKNKSKFMDIYTQKFIQRSQKVKYIADGKKKSGRIIGVATDDGSLIVADGEGNFPRLTAKNRVVISARYRKSK